MPLLCLAILPGSPLGAEEAGRAGATDHFGAILARNLPDLEEGDVALVGVVATAFVSDQIALYRAYDTGRSFDGLLPPDENAGEMLTIVGDALAANFTFPAAAYRYREIFDAGDAVSLFLIEYQDATRFIIVAEY